MLDDLPDEPVREWAPFSALELREALGRLFWQLSARSGPCYVGPPQTHCPLPPGCLDVFLTLANACLRVGHWPRAL